MKEYGEVIENVDLKSLNTYGVGGHARYLIKPYREKLIALFTFLKENNMKWFVLGKGSNVIFPDADFDGVIIKLDELNTIKFNGNECTVESGVLLGSLVNKTLEQGFTNLYFLFGIPGVLGSAILGNAGANGHEIFDYVKDVTFIDEEGNVVTLAKERIDYGYRYTEFKKRNAVILEATLILEKGDTKLAKEEMMENLNKRKATQPLEYKNAGSVFRNPKGMAAGKLIEDAGLKGKMIGGAMVSQKHANFIINYHNATSSDIIELIELIKKEIKEKNNIDLELEQIIVNW